MENVGEYFTKLHEKVPLKEECLSSPELKVMSIQDHWVYIMQYCHFLLLQLSTLLGLSKTGRPCVWPLDMCRDHPKIPESLTAPTSPLSNLFNQLVYTLKALFLPQMLLIFYCWPNGLQFCFTSTGLIHGNHFSHLSVNLLVGFQFFPCAGLCGWILEKLLYPLRTLC